MVWTADSVLIRELSFIWSALYREVPIHIYMNETHIWTAILSDLAFYIDWYTAQHLELARQWFYWATITAYTVIQTQWGFNLHQSLTELCYSY